MTSPLPSPSQDLREANQRLLGWLDRMADDWGTRCLASPEDIAMLLSVLMRAGSRLREHPVPTPGADPEFDLQLLQYRNHVERLRALLPSIHGQLLAERARLEAQRARVRSAAEWARASRQTL
jgi:hypothetical protein